MNRILIKILLWVMWMMTLKLMMLFLYYKKTFCIDDEIPIEELTNDQIIETVTQKTVTESSNPEEGEEIQLALISNREASDSIEKIIKYCKNPPDNFNIKME